VGFDTADVSVRADPKSSSFLVARYRRSITDSIRSFPVAWQNLTVVHYLKALGVGLLSAIAAAALYFAVKEAWAFVYIALVLAPRAEAASDGLSWDAFYPQTIDMSGPLFIGFVLGFWWMLRRQAVVP